MAIIKSLLEQDLYKFSMGQAVLHNFPKTVVKAELKVRSDAKLGSLKEKVDWELDELCKLRFKKDELDYLRSIRWLSSDYVDYLERFYLKRDQVHTDVTDDGQLVVWAEGPWRDVIYFEIPVLAIISELYADDQMAALDLRYSDIYSEGLTRLSRATMLFNECDRVLNAEFGTSFTLADFGLRRRFSGDWHDIVVKELKRSLWGVFVGTSNVYLAKKHGVKPIGTFAHEWYQSLQGENIRISEVQKVALDIWAKEYRGELGIALSDIFGFRAFLRDFDKYFAKLFDGCRHDSGDPFTWGEMLIQHYESLGIDPRTKVGCWSDSLDANKACAIAKTFCGRIKVSFGIGTFLTNNTGVPPLNMVFKLTESNGRPCCKISDAPGKGMCHDQAFVDYVKQEYQYRSIDE